MWVCVGIGGWFEEPGPKSLRNEADLQRIQTLTLFSPSLSLGPIYTQPHGGKKKTAQKDHRNQKKVVKDICEQLRAGDRSIVGVMIESHIHEGRQDVPLEGPIGLKPGISITFVSLSLSPDLNLFLRSSWIRSVGL